MKIKGFSITELMSLGPLGGIIAGTVGVMQAPAVLGIGEDFRLIVEIVAAVSGAILGAFEGGRRERKKQN